MDLTEVTTTVLFLITLSSLLVRLSPKAPPSYPPLVVCHIGALAILALAQSWIFEPLDRALGGFSLTNLISHLCMVFVLWTLTTLISGPLLDDGEDPRVLRQVVLVIALVGVVASFVALWPSGTSRGLDAYDDELPYIAYQAFSILPLWLPAFWLVPRLVRALRSASFHRLQVTYVAFLVAYSASVLCVASYAAVAAAGWLEPLRELLVFLTGGGGMIGFLAVPLVAARGTREGSVARGAKA